MTGQSPQTATAAVPVPADAPVAVSLNLFQHRQLWLKLATYRPLLVVGGFWVVLLAIAIVAYGRLTASGEQQRSEPRAPYPHEQAQQGQGASSAPAAVAPPKTDGSSETEPITAEPLDATPSNQTVPIWSLGLLVALCAGGCFTLSQQLSAARRPAPRQRRRQQPSVATAAPKNSGSRSAPVAAPTQKAKVAPKRMQPYRPVSGASEYTPASPPAAQQENPSAIPVTVVAEGSANRLDWPQDSLINTMDVRQRRSASSWLSS